MIVLLVIVLNISILDPTDSERLRLGVRQLDHTVTGEHPGQSRSVDSELRSNLSYVMVTVTMTGTMPRARQAAVALVIEVTVTVDAAATGIIQCSATVQARPPTA